MKKLLMVGLGDLGGHVLELLCSARVPIRIVASDIDEESGYRKTNLVQYVASQMGFDTNIDFRKIDLYNIEETAGLISDVSPDIIFTSASLQSWWVINFLPKEVFDKLDKARFGPWLPMHLTLLYKLMQAVKLSGRRPLVLNASFPDVTHQILSKIGLAPDCGIGNVHNLIQPIRRSVADILRVPVESVTVYVYMAHFVSHYVPRFGDTGKGSCLMKVHVDGRDMSGVVKPNEVFMSLPKRWRRTGSVGGQILTAASAASIIRAVALDSKELLHAPGPLGLPGGYPVRVGEKGAQVVLADGVSMEKAIAVNEEGNRVDGVEKVLDDGTAIFTEKEMAIMKEMLGYDLKQMKIEESEKMAKELGNRFKEFASRFRKA